MPNMWLYYTQHLQLSYGSRGNAHNVHCEFYY